MNLTVVRLQRYYHYIKINCLIRVINKLLGVFQIFLLGCTDCYFNVCAVLRLIDTYNIDVEKEVS